MLTKRARYLRYYAGFAAGPTVQIADTPSTLSLSSGTPTGTVHGIAKNASGKATGQTVYYTSSDTSVATVDNTTGVVTEVGAGTAIITGTLKDTQTVFLTSDFDNSSYGDFGHTPTAITIVDDPTGDGRGKVAQCVYSGGPGPLDSNVFMPGIHHLHFGESACFYGDVFIPSTVQRNTGDHRKLLYFKSSNNNTSLPNFVLILGGFNDLLDQQLYVYPGATSGLSDKYYQPSTGYPTLTPSPKYYDEWMAVRVGFTMSSAPSVADGIFRVWINGHMILNITDFNAAPDPTVDPSTLFMNSWDPGNQVDLTAAGAYSENRYWDNLKLVSGMTYIPTDAAVAAIQILSAAPNIPIRNPTVVRYKPVNADRVFLSNAVVSATSSDHSVFTVATVGDQLEITGVAPGTGTLTLSAGGHTATQTVTINSNPAFQVDYDFYGSDAAYVSHGTSTPISTEVYPVNGRGFDSVPSAGEDDNTVPHQFASHVKQTNANGTITFYQDVPAGMSGVYDIRFAAAWAGAGCAPYIRFFDGATLLFTLDYRTLGTVDATHAMDAAGNVRTFADWVSNNTAVRVTLAGSQLTVIMGDPAHAIGGVSAYTHLSATSVG